MPQTAPPKRLLTVLALVLGLAAGAAAPALAQAFGRVLVVVTDENGQPVEGVKITASCEDIPQYSGEAVTDKKGRAPFSFVDATHPYQFTIEHEGFRSDVVTMKPRIRDTARLEVTLTRTEVEPEPPPQAQTEVAVLTPAQERFNEGVVALQANDIATAKTKLLEARDLDPKLAAAYSGLGGIYVDEGDYEAALAAADRLLELEPGNSRGLRIRYLAQKELGMTAEAEATLAQLSAMQEGGGAAALVYNEGVAALKVGDRAAARKRFEEALAMEGDFVPALTGLAIVHLNDGEPAPAAELAERILAAEPKNVQALRVRYDAYRMMGDATKEEAAFEALAATDPQGAAEFMFEAGVKLFDANEFEQAVTLLERARQLRPDHPDVLYRLGLAYVNLDRKAEAKETLRKFLEVKPDHPEAPVAKEMLSYLG